MKSKVLIIILCIIGAIAIIITAAFIGFKAWVRTQIMDGDGMINEAWADEESLKIFKSETGFYFAPEKNGYEVTKFMRIDFSEDEAYFMGLDKGEYLLYVSKSLLVDEIIGEIESEEVNESSFYTLYKNSSNQAVMVFEAGFYKFHLVKADEYEISDDYDESMLNEMRISILSSLWADE